MDFARFIIVGVASNVLNLLIYTLANHIGCPVAFSTAIGYLLGLVNSYYLGKYWVFRKAKVNTATRLNGSEIARFLLVYTIGGLGMILITSSLVQRFSVDYTASWLIGACFAFFNNYAGSKWLVFK
jgi:putative flippase GtrA